MIVYELRIKIKDISIKMKVITTIREEKELSSKKEMHVVMQL